MKSSYPWESKKDLFFPLHLPITCHLLFFLFSLPILQTVSPSPYHIRNYFMKKPGYNSLNIVILILRNTCKENFKACLFFKIVIFMENKSVFNVKNRKCMFPLLTTIHCTRKFWTPHFHVNYTRQRLRRKWTYVIWESLHFFNFMKNLFNGTSGNFQRISRANIFRL